MKLKFYIIAVSCIIITQAVQGQVGINTATPNAQLDITSSNTASPANTDGILIPKINTFPATNPTALQQGMLVYLTTTTIFASVSRSPGFYYWDNPTTNWIGIQTNPSSNWNLLGNAGTSSSTNFLGTIDNIDFVIKRNNIRAGFIGDPNTASGNKNTSFGANSLNVGGTGIRNTAIGTNVMPSNTSGQLNVSVGDQSMFSNTTGSTNTVIGVGALYSNTTGNENVALGRNTLTSATTANNNTGLGFATLRQNVSGSNNVAIGHQAGYNEAGSNKLYIENSTLANGTDSSVNNALIYGEFDNRIVRTNGQLQIGNPTTTGYTFPTTRGTNGQILQTNGTGTLSWTNANSTLSVVRSILNANQVVNATGWQKINFNSVVFDVIGGEFVAGTSRFVATKTGYYEINAGFHTFNKNDSEQYAIAVYKNGVEYQETAAHHYGDKLISRIINCTTSLAVGDFIEIYIFNGNAPTTIDSFSGKTYFEVKQIR